MSDLWANKEATPRDRMDELLREMVVQEASDLRVTAGETPRINIAGQFRAMVGIPSFDELEIQEIGGYLASEHDWSRYQTTGDTNFGYEIEGVGRFRGNAARVRGYTALTLRYVRSIPPTLEELNLPPQYADFADLEDGLVLVTGQMGSGKNSSIAGMLGRINDSRDVSVVTLEHPVEFVFEARRAIFMQREVGTDTATYATGTSEAMRQAHKVIVVGEAKDEETFDALLAAADSGHLVFATVHAGGCVDAINRIINSFPPNQQHQVRSTLASVLRAVVHQSLIPTVVDETKRVAACEVMVVSRPIGQAIRDDRPSDIEAALFSRGTGSMAREVHLADLVKSNQISRANAEKHARDKAALARFLGAA